jgi:hypothetical protein
MWLPILVVGQPDPVLLIGQLWILDQVVADMEEHQDGDG